VARALLELGIQPHVIELNPRSVKAALRMGLKVHLGDAAHADIVTHAGIQGACVIVVTVPDPRSAKRILQNIHAMSPSSSVIVRSRYHIATPELWEMGAAFVVDEENVVGRELARQVVQFLKDADPDTTTCALPADETGG
jgi:Trk K+ transport system NAD-binding subunit